MERVIHIHPNKTGGTSLRRMLGIRHQPQHLRAVELRHRYPEWADAYTFAFVRNPFDRVVSIYEYKKLKTAAGSPLTLPSFDEWVRACFQEQAPARYGLTLRFLQPCFWWVSDGGAVIVDEVYRFESFEQETRRLQGTLYGLGIGFDWHLRNMKGYPRPKGYRAHYRRKETRQIVEAFFKEDLEAFGYAF